MPRIEDINDTDMMASGENRTCANPNPICFRDAVGDTAYCGSHQRY